MSNSPTQMTLSRRQLRSGPAIILTGFGLYLAMPPISLYPIALIALVPLLIRWQDITSPREAWLEAATAFFVLYALAGYWILRHPIWESAIASLGAAILLPLVQGLPFAAAVPFRREFGPLVGLASLITFALTTEYLLLHGSTALPWFLLGHTQADALLFNQFIDLTGVLGLTLGVWLVNGAALLLLTSSGIRRLVPLCAIVSVLAASYLYSDYRRDQLTSTGTVPVAVVQPAIPAEAWAEGPPHQRINRLSHLADSLLSTLHRPPQLMVWPETALPAKTEESYAQQVYVDLKDWAGRKRMPLLTGAIRYTDQAPGTSDPAMSQSRPYNSALLFSDAGIKRYDKRQLVPFAEGVPGASYWEGLSQLTINAGGISGYRAGKGSGLLQTDSLRFATQICFESLFGRLHRQEVQRGTSFLVVLAQNGWWGKSAGPIQHRSFTRLRAIESRRAVVMASVSGGSSLIRADGALVGQLGWMEPSAALFHVPVYEESPPYVKYGDWPGLIAVLFSAVLGLLYTARRTWR